MFRDATSQQQTPPTLQAFISLLTLVEALAAITEQRENAQCVEPGNVPTITLRSTGQAFAEIAKQVLQCKYVGVLALEPPDERQRLIGSSGLPPEEEHRLHEDTFQVPLADYIDTAAIAQLHTDQVVLLDLQTRPFVTTRSIHGARYRLVAPIMLHGRLAGLFTMAKTDEKYPDVYSAYSPEEIALAKGIARLAALVIEKVGLLQECAEAQAKEQRLQATARRYEDFISTASHELRTPLTTIKGNVQLAQRRVAALEKQAAQNSLSPESLRRIEQPLKETLLNFNRLERMILELLDFSRIQADKFIMRKQPCNLVEIVRQVVEEAQKNAEGRVIRLSLPEQSVVPIIADADRISEVVNNYLSNAHKYSPLEESIDVRLMVEDEQARVEVQDRGPGISPEDQAHIWERFYRAPGIEMLGERAVNSNLGLGLYLCKEIIELHQGQLGVNSTPGQGSTFWFVLELAKVSDEPENATT